ncbi:MAG: hypothetical protein ACOYVK_16415 [Bacillota bacterium]
MKVVAKPIDVVCWFDKEGIHPVRFRLRESEDIDMVIKIDKVTSKHLEKLAGNKMMVFDCQSIVNHKEQKYQIKYELDTCHWILFKI